jgi:hypothetical protein
VRGHPGLVAGARQMAALRRGGELPKWRRDGKELFFLFGDGYFAVDVKTDGASFEAGIPRPLFEVSTVNSSPLSAAPICDHQGWPAVPGPRTG